MGHNITSSTNYTLDHLTQPMCHQVYPSESPLLLLPLWINLTNSAMLSVQATGVSFSFIIIFCRLFVQFRKAMWSIWAGSIIFLFFLLVRGLTYMRSIDPKYNDWPQLTIVSASIHCSLVFNCGLMDLSRDQLLSN